jgi:hypothetical protein
MNEHLRPEQRLFPRAIPELDKDQLALFNREFLKTRFAVDFDPLERLESLRRQAGQRVIAVDI